MPLIDQLFVDLFLGESFADVTGLNGRHGRQPVPEALRPEAERMRGVCQARFRELQDPEFSINFAGRTFRVTVMQDFQNQQIFILRRFDANLLPFAKLGLPDRVQRAMLEKDLVGLVLVAGPMGAGKTTTAASLLVERLKLYGGMAVAIEDPPETPLQGEHGAGRCIQVLASRRQGGYPEQMRRAVRSGADLLLLGEIRDVDTAFEAAQSSINGHLILATTHAKNPIHAIERLQTFCQNRAPNANGILSEGLAMVLWQTLVKAPAAAHASEPPLQPLLQTEFLLVNGDLAAQAAIRDGAFTNLKSIMDEQRRSQNWRPQER